MSQGPAAAYAAIRKGVLALADKHRVGNDQTVALYAIARMALLEVRGLRGHVRAAELGYALADEISTSGPEAVG